MATIIDGKALAKKIRENLREECNELRTNKIIPKTASIITKKSILFLLIIH